MNALLLLTALALTPPPPPAPTPSRARESGAVDEMPGAEDDTSTGLIGEMEPMTQPALISGEPAEYTPEALENKVEGVLLAKCRLGIDGSVHNCRVIKGLPYLNDQA